MLICACRYYILQLVKSSVARVNQDHRDVPTADLDTDRNARLRREPVNLSAATLAGAPISPRCDLGEALLAETGSGRQVLSASKGRFWRRARLGRRVRAGANDGQLPIRT